MAILSDEIRDYIDRSVLCWLGTSDAENEPNVSPKEMFTHHGDTVLIAHLVSPTSVRNIKTNPRVCVSFVDIFVQKGFKLKGDARIIERNNALFPVHAKRLADLYSDKWPIAAIIEVNVKSAARILAPSYVLFPDATTEQSQIESAMRTYGVRPTGD